MPRDEVTAWLAKAAADLDAARFLRSNPKMATEIAAFNYQQAAEKALKGLLVLSGIVPPRIHDLRALLARLSVSLVLDEDTAEALTPFAVLTRYPGFEEQPDNELLDSFDSFAEACLELLRRSLGDHRMQRAGGAGKDIPAHGERADVMKSKLDENVPSECAGPGDVAESGNGEPE